MTAIKKFLFDRDFDAPAEPSAPTKAVEPEVATEPPAPALSEEDLLAAQQRGYAEGREDGIREAAEATEREIADALGAMPEKLAALFELQEQANRSIAEETLAVATAIARKAFPDLNARNALGEIERMVRDVLASVIDEPRVQIFVVPALRDPLTERLATIAERVGYDGRITVAGDKAMARGDCRVEWNNGGAQRNLETLWMQIDEIVERNLGEDVPRLRPADADAADAESAPQSASPAPAEAAAPATGPAGLGAAETGADEDEGTAETAEAAEAGDFGAAGDAPETAAAGDDEDSLEEPASEPTAGPAILDGDDERTESETPSDDEER